MYLLTTKQVESVLSNAASSGVSCGVGGLDKYKEVLLLVKNRVEELLEVDTLNLQVVTDHFHIQGTGYRNRNFRLSGAFLAEAPLVAIEHSIEGLLTVEASVDREYGLVEAYLGPGRYTVSYPQGFAVDVDKAYIDLPDWLQSVAKYALLHHYRLTSQAAATPANVSYGDLQPALQRELYARVVKRYQRPRAGVEFPLRTVRNG